jgi:hypothetical protein
MVMQFSGPYEDATIALLDVGWLKYVGSFWGYARYALPKARHHILILIDARSRQRPGH